MKTECHKFIIFLYLETLLVWVDKENSIEFLFNSCILLIYLLLFTFICKAPCTLIYLAIACLIFETKRKNQEKE